MLLASFLRNLIFYCRFALLIDEEKRRQAVALYLSTRSLQYGVNSLVKHGIIPYYQHGDTLLMALLNIQIMFSFMSYPDTLNVVYSFMIAQLLFLDL